ncbi:carboxymethylenebutenolidase [Paenibacillus baekrokdamisoli]|uniref:Carboxymethylenebutenolidase n=1 Tax=Paenibacillus baekrokdamisoli TaxID=1712516 RepID=A0A3G9JF33_9BACL|nr:alpha/beta fold hydrolase [Paenibacillus baekrokdamisoli]MBB3071160.1 hypothetical protein [Paenibacillus baekrokdamisoli]BBH21579.1 carboxymethylenebutenolidase [Paenibacillus baekrokdamisoli]
MRRTERRIFSTTRRKAGRRKRIALWIIGLLVVFFIIGLVVYYRLIYNPNANAQAAMHTNAKIRFIEQEDRLTFQPNGKAIGPSVIIYPGALVEPASYSAWAAKLAESGHTVYIIKMPLDLAVLGKNRADRIIDEHPGKTFVIGGHSLGGAIAARYAAEHADKLKGVFFLASYADSKGKLNQKGLPVLQLTASKDGILDWTSWEKDKKNLPAEAEYVSIEGGNHAQFASYDKHRGDKRPSISEKEQQDQLVKAMNSWLNKLK